MSNGQGKTSYYWQSLKTTSPKYLFYKGSSLTSVTVLWYLSKTHLSIYPSLVLVQPRKTCTCLTERLLMGRKESNQAKLILQMAGCTFGKPCL